MDLHENLYTISPNGEMCWSVRLTHREHPVFKAHFADNPLLPGFMQIEIAGRILGRPARCVKKARFFSPVKPEETLIYSLSQNGDTACWRVEKSGKKVAEFSLQ